MAGRFSKEYRPEKFVQLPFEDIAKAMAMREQQYNEAYSKPLEYQVKQSQIETRDIDRGFADKKIQEAVEKQQQLVKDVYGGDYGAASYDISRNLAKEASDPFWSWNKQTVEDWKKDKDLIRSMEANGKQTLTFDRSRLDNPYYDEATGKYNTKLGTSIESKLDWDKDMKDIWMKTLQNQQFSNEDPLSRAKEVDVNGTKFLQQKTTAFHGIQKSQYDKDKIPAFDEFKASNSYQQMKKALMKSKEYGIEGLTEEQAENKIKDKFNSIGYGLVDGDYSTSYQNEKVADSQTTTSGGGTTINNPFDINAKDVATDIVGQTEAIDKAKNETKWAKNSFSPILSAYKATKENAYKKAESSFQEKYIDRYRDYKSRLSDLEADMNLATNKKNISTDETLKLHKGDVLYTPKLGRLQQEYLDLKKRFESSDAYKQKKNLDNLKSSIDNHSLKEADNYLKDDKTFKLYKQQHKQMYNDIIRKGGTIDDFLNRIEQFNISVAKQPTQGYWVQNDDFKKSFDEDFSNKALTNDPIHVTYNDGKKGSTVSYKDALRQLAIKKDDDGKISFQSGMVVTENGVQYTANNGNTITIPPSYFSKGRQKLLKFIGKAMHEYRQYDDQYSKEPFSADSEVPGLGKIIVYPGKGYIWENNGYNSEIRPMSKLTNDIFGAVAKGTERN